ncbi:MAG: hypothetical protein NTV30_08945, partial [Chloroflexi bacterium]|nr:hypothetical protein [Chloroflexota bacterium]
SNSNFILLKSKKDLRLFIVQIKKSITMNIITPESIKIAFFDAKPYDIRCEPWKAEGEGE